MSPTPHLSSLIYAISLGSDWGVHRRTSELFPWTLHNLVLEPAKKITKEQIYRNKDIKPPLPTAARVPKRMPTADSFVGIPFMRPTLRMHCLSTLQRHTITGVGNKEESVREGSQLLRTSGLEKWLIHFFFFLVHTSVGMRV